MEPIEQIKQACGALKNQAEEEAKAWDAARAALGCRPHETLVNAAKRVRGDAQARGDVLRAVADELGAAVDRMRGERDEARARNCVCSCAGCAEHSDTARDGFERVMDVTSIRKLLCAESNETIFMAVKRTLRERPYLTLKQLAADIYNNACAHGWWTMKTTDEPLDPVARIPERLALIHSEVSEALEAYRESTGERAELARLRTDTYALDGKLQTPKPGGFASELADVIIRVLDLTAALGIDIDAAIEQKHAYNQTRPMRHGGKLC